MFRGQYTQSGFSLVELIVALAVFSIVLTITVGALLMLVGTNQQLQGEQSMMTNLSFALDSMTREIRTGTRYYCEESPNYAAGGGSNLFAGGNDIDTILGSDDVTNCSGVMGAGSNLKGVAFIEGGKSVTGALGKRIVYFYDKTDGKIYRKIGNETPQSIVSSGIYISNADFFVTGAGPLDPAHPDDDEYQATVTIFIEAKATSTAPASSAVQVQTTITQRTLDI